MLSLPLQLVFLGSSLTFKSRGYAEKAKHDNFFVLSIGDNEKEFCDIETWRAWSSKAFLK